MTISPGITRLDAAFDEVIRAIYEHIDQENAIGPPTQLEKLGVWVEADEKSPSTYFSPIEDMAFHVRRCAGQSHARVLNLSSSHARLHSPSSRGLSHKTAAVAMDDVQANAVQEGYNAMQNAAYWQTRPVSILSRLVTIGSELARWKINASLSGYSSGPPLLLDSLCRLGPAFVKVRVASFACLPSIIF
jgi:hypothetical protein